jgi:hypothetical protein
MLTAPLLRLAIALSLAVTLSLTPLNRSTKGLTPDGERPPTELIEHQFGFRNQSDADLTAWALARFDRAGLVLPPLVISFHDDRQVCGGNFGLYRAGDPASVDICGFNWDRFVVTAKKTVLHELAHAWTQQTLSEQAREQFLALRDLDTWGDDEYPWEEQGSEQAAEIIAWALIDEELQLATINDAGPDALTRAYEQLTGSLPTLFQR